MTSNSLRSAASESSLLAADAADGRNKVTIASSEATAATSACSAGTSACSAGMAGFLLSAVMRSARACAAAAYEDGSTERTVVRGGSVVKGEVR